MRLLTLILIIVAVVICVNCSKKLKHGELFKNLNKNQKKLDVKEYHKKMKQGAKFFGNRRPNGKVVTLIKDEDEFDSSPPRASDKFAEIGGSGGIGPKKEWGDSDETVMEDSDEMESKEYQPGNYEDYEGYEDYEEYGGY